MTAFIDLEAEARTLGGMTWADVAQKVADVVQAVDFRGAGHAELFDAILAMHFRGEQVNGSALRHACPKVSSETILGIFNEANVWPLPAARIVADLAARRRATRALALALEELEDTSGDYGDTIERLTRSVADASTPVVPVAPGPNIDEFLAEQVEYDWLVPDLLERGDRLILTGEEGKGKSTFMRTFAVQLAAGIYPFTVNDLCEPCRVLVVDCENSTPQNQRKYNPLRIQAGERLDPDRLVIRGRPDGLELDRQSDRRWLEEVVVANRPDVLITGPLYKLHNADPIEEKPARQLAQFLDRLRTRYGFALILEAHSPHAANGSVRPLRVYGASLWKRWPEFGLGLQEKDDQGTAELLAWRGMRDERKGWPNELRRGGWWPWQDVNAAVRLEGVQ